MKTNHLSLFKGYHFPMKLYWDNHKKGNFTQLSMDLTSKCNYQCDWCFNKHLINKKSTSLSLKEKERILKESVKLGAKTLVFPGTGEPTLDSDFYPLIKIAHKLGLITVVYTNLTGNITPEKIKLLHNNNVSIGIKLDSFNSYYFTKRYHTNRKTFNKFQKNLKSVIKTYKNTTESKDMHKIHRIIANMVLTKENKSELESISEFCKSKNIPLFIRPVKPVNWAKQNISEWKKIGNSSGKLTPAPELIDLAKKHNTLFSPSSTPENHCAIFSFGLTIKEDGDVQICPDHHESKGAFGNVKNENLKEILKKLTKKRKIKPGYCIMLPEIKH